MSDIIYLGRNGQRMGPYNWAQIASMAGSGQVQADDLAWHDGMINWQPAGQVLLRLGLNLVTQEAPPPQITPPPAVVASPGAGLGSKFARLLGARRGPRLRSG
jgi:hypothetical protein